MLLARYFMDSENASFNQINNLSNCNYKKLTNFSPNSGICQSFETAWTQNGHSASFAALPKPQPWNHIVELTDDGVLVNFASVANASAARVRSAAGDRRARYRPDLGRALGVVWWRRVEANLPSLRTSSRLAALFTTISGNASRGAQPK